jgi:hypothetical protein
MLALICNFAWKNTLAAKLLTLVNPLHLESPQMCYRPLAICFIACINWFNQYHLEGHQMGHALSKKASEHYSIVLHMFEVNRISISHDVVVN